MLEARLIHWGTGMSMRIGRITAPWTPRPFVAGSVPEPIWRRPALGEPSNPVQDGDSLVSTYGFATHYPLGGGPVPAKYTALVIWGPAIPFGTHALEGVQSAGPLLEMNAPIDPELLAETGFTRAFYWLPIDLDVINPERAKNVWTPVRTPIVGNPSTQMQVLSFICG